MLYKTQYIYLSTGLCYYGAYDKKNSRFEYALVTRRTYFEEVTNMTPSELWNAALGELELQISKVNFTTWFDGTFIYELDNGDVTIGVPNNFTKSWLESKYHEQIVKSLRRISDDDVRRVTYKVSKAKDGAVVVKEVVQEEAVTPETAQQATQSAEGSTESVKAAVAAVASDTQTDSSGLNPKYTFENYIVGKKTELAHAACMAVSEKPGQVYNPLFIYGSAGLGKTHLMQAVGHALLKHDPTKKVLYVTCETFTNEFIKLVREGGAEEFKNKYRSVDILMVDDIQFLAGKEGTQEAFFHTFNHLHQRNKQIILTSDRPPRAIPTLENRLVSRFEGGMMVDVSLPDLETRIAILKLKASLQNVEFSEEILQFIASNVQNNIRELEGALNRVIAFHQLNKGEPSIESVKSLISSYSQTTKRGAITAKKILETVSEFFEISREDIKGGSRKKELVVPRQIAMYIMREEIHASYPNIGQELGGRDHTTAMHACQKIGKLLDEDEKMQSDINMIKERLYN